MRRTPIFQAFEVDRSVTPVKLTYRLKLFSDGTIEGDLLGDLQFFNDINGVIRPLEAKLDIATNGEYFKSLDNDNETEGSRQGI